MKRTIIMGALANSHESQIEITYDHLVEAPSSEDCRYAGPFPSPMAVEMAPDEALASPA